MPQLATTAARGIFSTGSGKHNTSHDFQSNQCIPGSSDSYMPFTHYPCKFSFPTHFSLTGWRQLILSRDPHRSPQSLQLSVSRHWFQARQLSSAIKRQSSPGMWIHFSIYSDRRWTCHSQFSSAVKVTGYLKCRKASLCTWLPFFPPQYQ